MTVERLEKRNNLIKDKILEGKLSNHWIGLRVDTLVAFFNAIRPTGDVHLYPVVPGTPNPLNGYYIDGAALANQLRGTAFDDFWELHSKAIIKRLGSKGNSNAFFNSEPEARQFMVHLFLTCLADEYKDASNPNDSQFQQLCKSCGIVGVQDSNQLVQRPQNQVEFISQEVLKEREMEAMYDKPKINQKNMRVFEVQNTLQTYGIAKNDAFYYAKEIERCVTGIQNIKKDYKYGTSKDDPNSPQGYSITIDGKVYFSESRRLLIAFMIDKYLSRINNENSCRITLYTVLEHFEFSKREYEIIKQSIRNRLKQIPLPPEPERRREKNQATDNELEVHTTLSAQQGTSDFSDYAMLDNETQQETKGEDVDISFDEISKTLQTAGVKEPYRFQYANKVQEFCVRYKQIINNTPPLSHESGLEVNSNCVYFADKVPKDIRQLVLTVFILEKLLKELEKETGIQVDLKAFCVQNLGIVPSDSWDSIKGYIDSNKIDKHVGNSTRLNVTGKQGSTETDKWANLLDSSQFRQVKSQNRKRYEIYQMMNGVSEGAKIDNIDIKYIIAIQNIVRDIEAIVIGGKVTAKEFSTRIYKLYREIEQSYPNPNIWKMRGQSLMYGCIFGMLTAGVCVGVNKLIEAKDSIDTPLSPTNIIIITAVLFAIATVVIHVIRANPAIEQQKEDSKTVTELSNLRDELTQQFFSWELLSTDVIKAGEPDGNKITLSAPKELLSTDVIGEGELGDNKITPSAPERDVDSQKGSTFFEEGQGKSVEHDGVLGDPEYTKGAPNTDSNSPAPSAPDNKSDHDGEGNEPGAYTYH